MVNNMSNEMSWYVHGLWILGAVFMFLAAMIAGNIEMVEGTTWWSYWLAILISFALFLIGGYCWISSGANTIREERIIHHYDCHCDFCKHHKHEVVKEKLIVEKEKDLSKDIHKREIR